MKKYPVAYFDSTPEFTITPFLSQYVFTFNDKIPSGTSKKYNGTTPVTTTVSDSVSQGYKITPGFPEQIIYIPGGDYLSSMGDLSLKYPSQLTIMNGKRLLDLTVGSDVPGYVNNLLGVGTGQFEMNDSATNSAGGDNPNKKSLLEKVVLTNLSQLHDAIDVSGSEKLIEFRALNTQIPRVIFAEGAPLDTVHLPSTVNGLSLVESKNLTRILDVKPVVCTLDGNGVAHYADRKNYSGLYIEGVTDATDATTTTNLNSLSIIGGGLGYDSYKLIEKLVNIKKKMVEKDPTASVALNLENVQWSPYTVVPTDANYNSAKTYYRLTDHSNFVEYTFTTADEWKDLLLNGKIFTYDKNAPQSTITDTSLFDLFLQNYEKGVAAGNKVNNYTNTQNSGKTSVPNITGSVFISNANGTPIEESDITDKYQVRWPNLNFYAANINEAYVAKYVQITDSGKEQELEVLRSAKTETTPKITSKIPTRSYYDFKGYAIDKAGSNIVVDYDASTNALKANTNFDNIKFSDTNSVITFYAVFVKHPYNIEYHNVDDSLITTLTATYGEPIPDPKIICSTDESALDMYQTYKFKGYTKERTNSITTASKLKSVLLDLSKTQVTQDTIVYACYVQQSVYDEPINSDYFTFINDSYIESSKYKQDENGYLSTDGTYNTTGVTIHVKPGVHLSGKITLPTYSPDGKPVIGIDNSFATDDLGNTWSAGTVGGKDITHIFWYKESGKPCLVRMIKDNAFAAKVATKNPSHLQYVEMPDSLRYISGSAFFWCASLDASKFELPQGLFYIDNSAFNNAFAAESHADVLKIPSTVASIGFMAFYNCAATFNSVRFGNGESGSQLYFLSHVNYVRGGTNSDSPVFTFSGTAPTSIEFYAVAQDQSNAFVALAADTSRDHPQLRGFNGIAVTPVYVGH